MPNMSEVACNSARIWAIAVNTAEIDYLDEMLEISNIETDLRIAAAMYQMNRKHYTRYHESGMRPIRVFVSPHNNWAGITKL